MILTVVDRFSKAAHFVPLPRIPSAAETGNLLMHHVFCLHGFPRDIVSDRGPQFTPRVSILHHPRCVSEPDLQAPPPVERPGRTDQPEPGDTPLPGVHISHGWSMPTIHRYRQCQASPRTRPRWAISHPCLSTRSRWRCRPSERTRGAVRPFGDKYMRHFSALPLRSRDWRTDTEPVAKFVLYCWCTCNHTRLYLFCPVST